VEALSIPAVELFLFMVSYETSFVLSQEVAPPLEWKFVAVPLHLLLEEEIFLVFYLFLFGD
jgi:hypothetical protein